MSPAPAADKTSRAMSSVLACHLPTAVAEYLQSPSEVLRCRAARVLGELGDSCASKMLVDVLLDEDPDVRSDAMGALINCAQKGAASAIRRSLKGDPVAEVKLAAIKVLSRLDDQDSVPLLRNLVLGRCEESVYWDDSVHGWDDWLDVQLAAIEALGDLGDARCIPDLLHAQKDEMGQAIEVVLFRAFAKLGTPGLNTLFGFTKHPDAIIRRQAIMALLQVHPDELANLADGFAKDPDARIREFAASKLVLSDGLLRELAETDSSAGVRVAAIASILQTYRQPSRDDTADGKLQLLKLDIDVLVRLLEDNESVVRLASLGALIELAVPSTFGVQREALTIALSEGIGEIVEHAESFAFLLGEDADCVLCETLADVERPLECRVAVAKAMGYVKNGAVLDSLHSGVTDKHQQLRLACLQALRHWCIDDSIAPNDEIDSLILAAASVLRRAISGDMLSLAEPDKPVPRIDSLPPSVEQAIQWHGKSPGEAQGASSTLESIRAESYKEPASQIEHSESQERLRSDRGKRRRVSIEGPDDYSIDLGCTAAMVAAAVPDAQIEEALSALLDGPNEQLLSAAVNALCMRTQYMPINAKVAAKLRQQINHESASVRYHAALALLNSEPDACLVDELCQDEDALCRGLAMRNATTELAVAGLADRSEAVRLVSVKRLLEVESLLPMKQLIDSCVASGAVESIRYAAQVDDGISAEIALQLSDTDTPARSVDTLLIALGPT